MAIILKLMKLKGKKVLLGVCGGIAAYKACELVRRLTDQGADVHVILTASGQQFITPLTFQSLTHNPVHTDLFNLTEESEMSHIKLADEADIVIIAPATADILAKMAVGMANDLLTTVVLVTHAPIFLAPSMNVNMWEKEIVQQNIQTLRNRGYHFIEPEEGYLACGWEGKGRLAETEAILQALQGLASEKISKKKSLAGRSVLINAGPTREYLDPVRFISNPSSGRMGFALAEEARERGAKVTLVTGPVALPTPEGVRRVDVSSAEEMFKACKQAFAKADIFIATAAVGDYAPAAAKQKIKKSGKSLKLEMNPTVDILQTIARAKRKGQLVIGFAAETQDILRHAKEKMQKKNLDLVIANDVSKKDRGFTSEQNAVIIINRSGKIDKTGLLPKAQIAKKIWDKVEAILSKAKVKPKY
jgi:phosphopantothenoylcysteine decarboxylase / phosphopantothenate---cysteine ligase